MPICCICRSPLGLRELKLQLKNVLFAVTSRSPLGLRELKLSRMAAADMVPSRSPLGLRELKPPTLWLRQ